ncbi:MAG: hypothetical protein K6G00_12875 [Treponema sp.]|nr:hypothetical protein [Treponema sp.]
MVMSKKFLNVLYILCFFVYASCSKKNSPAKKLSTLRDEAVILESRLSWADELPEKPEEYVLLEQDVGSDPVLVILNQETAGKSDQEHAHYPSLPDFTVLDTSAYEESQKSVIENFCTAIIQRTSADSYIMSGYMHAMVLFRYNLEKEGVSLENIEDYVLGKPFINEKECQCPVRFYLDDETYIDVNLYIVKAGQNWKIHQIEYKARKSIK